MKKKRGESREEGRGEKTRLGRAAEEEVEGRREEGGMCVCVWVSVVAGEWGGLGTRLNFAV